MVSKAASQLMELVHRTLKVGMRNWCFKILFSRIALFHLYTSNFPAYQKLHFHFCCCAFSCDFRLLMVLMASRIPTKFKYLNLQVQYRSGRNAATVLHVYVYVYWFSSLGDRTKYLLLRLFSSWRKYILFGSLSCYLLLTREVCA